MVCPTGSLGVSYVFPAAPGWWLSSLLFLLGYLDIILYYSFLRPFFSEYWDRVSAGSILLPCLVCLFH
jgi:hypothetical protein